MKTDKIRILVVCLDGYTAITEFQKRIREIDTVKEVRINRRNQTIENKDTFLKFTTSSKFFKVAQGKYWSHISFIGFQPDTKYQEYARARTIN